MNTKLTVEQVVTSVRALVQASPGFCYPAGADSGRYQCVYTPYPSEGETGCIFGQALHDLGVSQHVLQGFDRSGGTPIKVVFDMLKLPCDSPELIPWCVHVQILQDHGSAWSRCVAEADRLFLKKEKVA